MAVTGGRNGYGAKLTNIFSSKFIVETNDTERGLKFKQEFRNNMSERDAPVIGPCDRKSGYTCITFTPDLKRFGMHALDGDILALMRKRVYDMAGITDKSLKVFYNGERVPVTCFKDYVGLYQNRVVGTTETETETEAEGKGDDGDGDGDGDVGAEASTSASASASGFASASASASAPAPCPVIYCKLNERWEIGIGLSDGQFQQVSFVNGICTSKGGQHVAYIADQITEAVAEVANKKSKREKGMEIKGHHVRSHMSLFLNCLIENPAFDSQTKETLTTRAKAFGSTGVVPERVIKQIMKLGLLDSVLVWAKFKETATLSKKGGVKRAVISGIPKLDDANFAGTAKVRPAPCLIWLLQIG